MATFQQNVKNIYLRRSKSRLIRVPALQSCPFKKAIIVKVRIMKPKKPNSANRKITKIRLSTGRKVLAQIPGLGHTLQEHASVLVNGKRIRDLPGMHYRLVKGVYDFTYREAWTRKQARSRYGYPNTIKVKRSWGKKTKTRKKRKNKMAIKNIKLERFKLLKKK
jgi:small subunit ribosomal protein S12